MMWWQILSAALIADQRALDSAFHTYLDEGLPEAEATFGQVFAAAYQSLLSAGHAGVPCAPGR